MRTLGKRASVRILPGGAGANICHGHRRGFFLRKTATMVLARPLCFAKTEPAVLWRLPMANIRTRANVVVRAGCAGE